MWGGHRQCDVISNKTSMSQELNRLVKTKKKKQPKNQTDKYYGNDVLILSHGQVIAFRNPKDLSS